MAVHVNGLRVIANHMRFSRVFAIVERVGTPNFPF